MQRTVWWILAAVVALMWFIFVPLAGSYQGGGGGRDRTNPPFRAKVKGSLSNVAERKGWSFC